jgi:thiol-disulfide isomerase/thioredoxin
MRLFFVFILVFMSGLLPAQNSYTVGDQVKDFPVDKILNYTEPASTFNKLNEKLLVVDFFGTWCVPCIKALPKLTSLQDKFKNELKVVLVSDEAEDKLQTFMRKQNSFVFPVVVDEKASFINAFAPPAYPYTVIIAQKGTILAVPKQEEITEENIMKWLALQNSAMAPVEIKNDPIVKPSEESKTNIVESSSNKLVELSQQFMYAAKTGDATESFIDNLKSLSYDELRAVVKTDDEKKAFWINLYNAYTQVFLKANPDQYKKRGSFFGSKKIEIAGKKFSLDDIEHGIIRRSKVKWSLGHLSKLFPNRTEKELRTNKLDYRIHFALNCGAKSCPPIAFYKPETIDKQLDIATKAYLTAEAEYDKVANTVKLPTILSWFRRDFGGKGKMIELLKKISILPAEANPKIRFKKYDWTLYLQNYKG